MKMADLPTHEEVLAANLRDLEFRAEWQRTRIGDAIATRIVAYRADHGLTQTELARKLGMSQPAVARLESGVHEPALATLARLSRGLGIAFRIDITPETCELLA